MGSESPPPPGLAAAAGGPRAAAAVAASRDSGGESRSKSLRVWACASAGLAGVPGGDLDAGSSPGSWAAVTDSDAIRTAVTDN